MSKKSYFGDTALPRAVRNYHTFIDIKSIKMSVYSFD